MTNESDSAAVRIALGIEYDGSQFHGWQRQTNSASVQSQLESALTQVAAHPVEVVCAGRTDTGVHALEQIVHFDCYSNRSAKAWLKGANSLLSSSVSIRFAQQVKNDFHARFSALSRTYLYIIDNHAVAPAILSHGLSWYKQPLQIDRMNQACEHFIGEHDFSSLRSSRCQSKTANRQITHLSCQRYGEYIAVRVKANAFLHHMVRNIVGVLLEIGDNRRPPDWAKLVIDTKDRTKAGITAKPNGLYLQSVEYPTAFKIPHTKPHSIIVEQFLQY